MNLFLERKVIFQQWEMQCKNRDRAGVWFSPAHMKPCRNSWHSMASVVACYCTGSTWRGCTWDNQMSKAILSCIGRSLMSIQKYNGKLSIE